MITDCKLRPGGGEVFSGRREGSSARAWFEKGYSSKIDEAVNERLLDPGGRDYVTSGRRRAAIRRRSVASSPQQARFPGGRVGRGRQQTRNRGFQLPLRP
ncbi:hypothetical protein SBA6_580003 [Candidatus Sulfopaludibacter sp. SbA6]|nr:hypothetical protein SBA6_580003 [Candidatus Sulfopaludibacter sp. SbA6]